MEIILTSIPGWVVLTAIISAFASALYFQYKTQGWKIWRTKYGPRLSVTMVVLSIINFGHIVLAPPVTSATLAELAGLWLSATIMMTSIACMMYSNDGKLLFGTTFATIDAERQRKE